MAKVIAWLAGLWRRWFGRSEASLSWTPESMTDFTTSDEWEAVPVLKSRQVRRAELRREAKREVNATPRYARRIRWQRRLVAHQWARALWRKETA